MLARLIFLCLLALPAQAAAREVDVELVLAVDVSLSMTANEIEIQRRGYAEAITSPEVMTAIRGGLLGEIAITYIEWADSWHQRTLIDWTRIETPEDARSFADALLAAPIQTQRRTSISSALTHAAGMFEENEFSGLRRVIDISGDGPNNAGLPVTTARDALVAQGIIINGLPLMTREGFGGRWTLDDLDRYYTDCVIGGPGAFVIPVTSWMQFADAVRRKLVLDIAGAPQPRLYRASTSAGYDCLIGEKIWQEWQNQSGGASP